MRERVFGVETEYGILFKPAVAGGPVPTSRELYELIEKDLKRRFRTLPARHRGKRGLFLENGTLVSFETTDGLNGLLEVATPECRSARDVTIYQAASDRIVEELARMLPRRLAGTSTPGTVVFSKSGADGKGHIWGTHENYYVDDPSRATAATWTWDIVCRTFWLASMLIANVLSWLVVLAGLAIVLAYVAMAAVVFGALSLGLLMIGGVLRRPMQGPIGSLGEGLRFGLEALVRRLQDVAVGLIGRLCPLLVRPSLRLYERFLERSACRPFVDGLTSFLVTRPVWCGSGRLWLGAPAPLGVSPQTRSARSREQRATARAFTILSRAASMRNVAGVGEHAEFLFDLKSCIHDAFSVQRRRKRIEIICGDASMTERSVYLRIGVTGLLLRMVEEGERFDELRLADPMATLQGVSADEDMHRLYRLADGRARTALEIQRLYLERAERFYTFKAPSPGRGLGVGSPITAEAADLLAQWRWTLDALASDAGQLAGHVDWITKRTVMRQAAAERRSTLEEMDAAAGVAADVVGAIGGEPGLDAKLSEQDVKHRLTRGLAPARLRDVRKALEYHEWTWTRLLDLCRLAYEMRRFDLRWHEVSADRSIFDPLRAPGRLSSDDELSRATREAPSDTRAALRAELVRRHAEDPSRRTALSWTKFHGPTRSQDRSFPEPL